MFISWYEWKMIKVFDAVDCIEPKNLSKSLSDFSEAEIKKILDSLTKNNIVNFFYVGGGYNEYCSYNLQSTGKQIAKRGFFKHNVIELFILIDNHKAWISIIVGIISLTIVLRKC